MKYFNIFLIAIFFSGNIYSQDIQWEYNIIDTNNLAPYKIIKNNTDYYISLEGVNLVSGFSFIYFPAFLKLDRINNNWNIDWLNIFKNEKPIFNNDIFFSENKNLITLNEYYPYYNNGYIYGGYLNIIELDSNGNIISNSLDSSSQQLFTCSGLNIKTKDQIIGFYFPWVDSLSKFKMYIKKYNMDGNLQNGFYYDFIPDSLTQIYYNITNILYTSDNGFIILGQGIKNGDITNDVMFPFILKYDQNFNEEWITYFNDNIQSTFFRDIIQSNDSTYIIIGESLSPSTNYDSDSACFIMKLNKTGNIINKSYLRGFQFTKIKSLYDNYLLCGKRKNTTGDSAGFRILYLNSNFIPIKDYMFHFDSDVDKNLLDLYVDNNEIIVCGVYNSSYLAVIDSFFDNNLVIDCDCGNKTITVSPNPFDDHIDFDIPAGEAWYELYDILGNCVKRDNLSNIEGKVSIYTSDLREGVYILKLNYGGSTKIAKIIKN